MTTVSLITTCVNARLEKRRTNGKMRYHIGACMVRLPDFPQTRIELCEYPSKCGQCQGATIIICEGRDILELVSQDPFPGQRSTRRDIVQFVSVQAKQQQPFCAPPFSVPTTGRWCVKVLSQYKRFVIGMHRREMAAIKYLGGT